MIFPFFATERSTMVNNFAINREDIMSLRFFINHPVKLLYKLFQKSIEMFNDSPNDVKKFADLYLYTTLEILLQCDAS